METKVCNECDEEKEASAFFSYVDGRDGKTYLSAACKPCTNARLRRWRAENRDRCNANQRAYATPERKKGWPSREYQGPEYTRARRHLTKYGVTVEQYDEMLERQGGVCALCKRPETMTYKGTLRALALDHDHATGRVRGLLCFECNVGLGKFAEDPEMLLEAAEYLLAAQDEEVINAERQ